MKVLLVLSILFCGVISFAHIDDSEISLFSESGIYGNSYAEIKKELAQLNQKYPHLTEVIPLSNTVRGRVQYGILIFNKEVGRVDRLSIITGATHGNEYLNIADRLPRSFLEGDLTGVSNYILNNGAILIVPIINPDGYEARQRRNKNGQDLNRDFPNRLIQLKGLSQPETSQYVLWVNQFVQNSKAQLDIVVDYHCCDGSLLYPYGYTSKRINKTDLDRHIFVAELMQTHFPSYRHGITGELLGYFPRGTTKDYWFMDFGALSFTFEGQYRKEHKKLKQHEAWWNDIFSFFHSPLLPTEM